MVIHDMRNPTNAIQFGVMDTLEKLRDHFDKFRILQLAFEQSLTVTKKSMKSKKK